MRNVLFCTLAITLMTPSAQAGLFEPGRLLECRPCGPNALRGPIRFFFPQGCKGADFRDACRKHDNYYSTYGFSKELSDSIFLADMLAACANSRRPEKAERRARWMYGLVARFGHGAYSKAQQVGNASK